jgi:hypothetical protein
MRTLSMAALGIALVLLFDPAAGAVPECGGEVDSCPCGGVPNPCICHSNGCGNCVWWAWESACCNWALGIPWCPDARLWDDNAESSGYPTGTDPRSSSIFVCEPSDGCSSNGHVGWIVSVYADGSFDSTEQCYGGCSGGCSTISKHRVPGSARYPSSFIYNPSSPAAACGNGTCETGERCDTCPSDCGTCAAACGDGVCSPGESCSTCPVDCGECGIGCGDGTCESDEDCSACASDCGVCAPGCGDGVCGSGEDCSGCPADCGSCPAGCGDGWCDSDEDCYACPSDCGSCGSVCGDGWCDADEDC